MACLTGLSARNRSGLRSEWKLMCSCARSATLAGLRRSSLHTIPLASLWCSRSARVTALGRKRKSAPRPIMSALPPKADIRVGHRHVCFGPCVDGSGLARRIFTLQHWSVQPCVRPVCAVLMTAGHTALRGSGPGQKHAFDDAVALVGCPDRRIDRHCITCCSPSQPLRQHRSLRRDLGYAVSAAGSL